MLRYACQMSRCEWKMEKAWRIDGQTPALWEQRLPGEWAVSALWGDFRQRDLQEQRPTCRLLVCPPFSLGQWSCCFVKESRVDVRSHLGELDHPGRNLNVTERVECSDQMQESLKGRRSGRMRAGCAEAQSGRDDWWNLQRCSGPHWEVYGLAATWM